jgi:hypothetical protein
MPTSADIDTIQQAVASQYKIDRAGIVADTSSLMGLIAGAGVPNSSNIYLMSLSTRFGA